MIAPAIVIALIDASTDPSNGLLNIGGTNNSVLSTNVPASLMAAVTSGQKVLDAVGVADGLTRDLLRGTLTVVQGVAR